MQRAARDSDKKNGESYAFPPRMNAFLGYSNLVLTTFGGPSSSAGFARYCLKR